jgi:hypothetical protein
MLMYFPQHNINAHYYYNNDDISLKQYINSLGNNLWYIIGYGSLIYIIQEIFSDAKFCYRVFIINFLLFNKSAIKKMYF